MVRFIIRAFGRLSGLLRESLITKTHRELFVRSSIVTPRFISLCHFIGLFDTLLLREVFFRECIVFFFFFVVVSLIQDGEFRIVRVECER